MIRNWLWVHPVWTCVVAFPLLWAVWWFYMAKLSITNNTPASKKMSMRESGLWSLVFSVMFGGMAFLLMVSHFSPGTVIIRNHQVVASFQYWTSEWAWEHDTWNRSVAAVKYEPQVFSVTKQIEALTANPGIRRVKVYVELEAAGTPESLLAFQESDWAANRWDKLRSTMNRFDKLYHSRVAEACYDDLDPGQQRQLQAMVLEFLAPELGAKGLRLRTAYFKLPES